MRKLFGISRYILVAAFLLMSFGVVMATGEVGNCSALIGNYSYKVLDYDNYSSQWFVNTYDNGSAIHMCSLFEDCMSYTCSTCDEDIQPYDSFFGYQQELIESVGGLSIDKNMKNADVKVLQEVLNEKCGSSLSIDCRFGRDTLKALGDCSYCETLGLESKIYNGDEMEMLCEDGQTENRDAPYCCESCIVPVDGSCADEARILNSDETCCICSSPTNANADECVVEEPECIHGTVSGGSCDVEIEDEEGTAKTVNVTVVDPVDGESTEKDCSKGGTLLQGQSCCDGYKEVDDVCKPCGEDGVCCGVSLNTNVPFIGDCIQFQKSASDPDTTVVGPTTAFPKLMQGLSKLMVTAILVFSFVLLIVAGVMMAAGGASDSAYTAGKKLIGKVVIGIALLGASGVILKLINPNFFG